MTAARLAPPEAAVAEALAYVNARRNYEALGDQEGNFFTAAEEHRLREAMLQTEAAVIEGVWERQGGAR